MVRPLWKTPDVLAPGTALGKCFDAPGCLLSGCGDGKTDRTCRRANLIFQPTTQPAVGARSMPRKFTDALG